MTMIDSQSTLVWVFCIIPGCGLLLYMVLMSDEQKIRFYAPIVRLLRWFERVL